MLRLRFAGWPGLDADRQNSTGMDENREILSSRFLQVARGGAKWIPVLTDEKNLLILVPRGGGLRTQ